MINHKFYKLAAIQSLLQAAHRIELKLFEEMASFATDDIKFIRRARMLRNLAETKAQLLAKISNFETEEKQNYLDGIAQSIININQVTSRNA